MNRVSRVYIAVAGPDREPMGSVEFIAEPLIVAVLRTAYRMARAHGMNAQSARMTIVTAFAAGVGADPAFAGGYGGTLGLTRPTLRLLVGGS